MNPGTLRLPVTLQSLTVAQTDNGEVTDTFTTLATTWASIMPISGRELIGSGGVYAENAVRIRTRFVSGVKPSGRVVYTESASLTHTYEINHVNDTGMLGKELELICSEVVAP